MADTDWHYIENQFDNSTKNSYKRMKQQATFHLTAVGNAPAAIVAVLQNRIAVANLPFATKYNEWQLKRGQLKGATQAYEERIALLAGAEIEEIETAFKGGYKRGTPEHTSAFPQGREPFQRGGADGRITALGTLQTRCTDLLPPLEAGLAAAQANAEPQAVIDEWQLRVLSMGQARGKTIAAESALDGLRTMQNDLDTETGLARTAIEPLRVVVADALYANFGGLAQVLSTAALRPQIASFFNLEILRETTPDEEEPAPIPPPAPPPVPPGP